MTRQKLWPAGLQDPHCLSALSGTAATQAGAEGRAQQRTHNNELVHREAEGPDLHGSRQPASQLLHLPALALRSAPSNVPCIPLLALRLQLRAHQVAGDSQLEYSKLHAGIKCVGAGRGWVVHLGSYCQTCLQGAHISVLRSDRHG